MWEFVVGVGVSVELAVLVAWTKWRMRRDGFDPTVQWATTLRGTPRADTPRTRRRVERAMARSMTVFRWHPVPNKCLERTLVMCRYLARRRVPAQMVIAVRKYPFESHAWARWGGMDLTEPPHSEHVDDFRVLARFPRPA